MNTNDNHSLSWLLSNCPSNDYIKYDILLTEVVDNYYDCSYHQHCSVCQQQQEVSQRRWQSDNSSRQRRSLTPSCRLMMRMTRDILSWLMRKSSTDEWQLTMLFFHLTSHCQQLQHSSTCCPSLSYVSSSFPAPHSKHMSTTRDGAGLHSSTAAAETKSKFKL